MTQIVKQEPQKQMQFSDVVAAVQDGKLTPETVSKMLDVFERHHAFEAKRQFVEAMATFKQTCPPIPRKTESQFKVTRNGATVPRLFASLEDIAKTINKPLAECGLDYRWGDSTYGEGRITTECIISHVGGHVERCKQSMPTESSGGSSAQQKAGIAETYAMRYSLIKALGLTTCEDDNDGQDPTTTINDEQQSALVTALDAKRIPHDRFLGALGYKTFAEIPASKFAEYAAMIEKRKATA